MTESVGLSQSFDYEATIFPWDLEGLSSYYPCANTTYFSYRTGQVVQFAEWLNLWFPV